MTPAELRTLVLQTVAGLVGLGLVLFGAAGTLAWAQGWAFLALYLCFTLATIGWLLRHDPALLRERMRPVNADQPAWDRLFIVTLLALCVVWFAVIPLDAMRLHWSHVPAWLQAAGGIALTASLVLFFVTFRENSYLSPAVRIQRERGHRVVSTGPYRYVRHPLYSGFVLFVLGTALFLGSWYGTLLSIFLSALVAWRAVQEERTLRTALEGYEAYMSRVRFRLIPGVW